MKKKKTQGPEKMKLSSYYFNFRGKLGENDTIFHINLGKFPIVNLYLYHKVKMLKLF